MLSGCRNSSLLLCSYISKNKNGGQLCSLRVKSLSKINLQGAEDQEQSHSGQSGETQQV